MNARDTPAGDYDYEQGGGGYAEHRRADPRIAALVHGALGDATSVVNVGAGAGSYEPTERAVTAVEPSAAMRAQRAQHLSPAVDATAENLPFPDDSFDAAMAMVTIHQWRDPDRGLRELRRVARGPVVIMTFDGPALQRFWLADYAPDLFAAECRRYPTIQHVCEILGGSSVVVDVPIPFDCADGFGEAFYGRPERFLDPQVRRAQSIWGLVEPAAVESAIGTLRADLAGGAWDLRYGRLRHQPEYVGSVRLITAQPGSTRRRPT